MEWVDADERLPEPDQDVLIAAYGLVDEDPDDMPLFLVATLRVIDIECDENGNEKAHLDWLAEQYDQVEMFSFSIPIDYISFWIPFPEATEEMSKISRSRIAHRIMKDRPQE